MVGLAMGPRDVDMIGMIGTLRNVSDAQGESLRNAIKEIEMLLIGKHNCVTYENEAPNTFTCM